MTPEELAELLKYIHQNHGWYARFALDKKDNKFIKYVDMNFDTRDGNVWRVNLRRGLDNKEFRGGNIKKQIYDWLDNVKGE